MNEDRERLLTEAVNVRLAWDEAARRERELQRENNRLSRELNDGLSIGESILLAARFNELLKIAKEKCVEAGRS